MDFGFKEILFGIAGVSMIAWVAVIGLWHTYMFPRFFKEDSNSNSYFSSIPSITSSGESFSEVGKGAVRPSTKSIGLSDRNKYSRQSLVLADFNPIESDYGVNRLYTVMLLSLGVMSFVIITYGLQSGFNLI
tara:strand:- start:331 stop:726 length:396 start_codon:yes stop_codon:yes gene_type:complete